MQGYPQQPSGYPPQPSGYPPQPSGYPAPTGGYPPQQPSGYPPQQPSGYPPQQPSGPPQQPPTNFRNSWYSSYYTSMNPQELQAVQAWFTSVDQDRSGTISANEVASITFNGAPLGWEVGTKLVKTFDKDRSGNINFFEYAAMHKFLTSLQAAFFTGDRDRSGRLDAREIHTALGTAGLPSPPQVVGLFAAKYDRGYGVTFQEFLLICASMAQVRSLFAWRDPQKTGRVSLSLDEMLEVVAQLL